jgi:hypothetical protein
MDMSQITDTLYHRKHLWNVLDKQHNIAKGSGGSMSLVVGLPNNSYKPITNTAWVRARFCELQKRMHATRSRK